MTNAVDLTDVSTPNLSYVPRPIPLLLDADAREQYRRLPMDGPHNFRDLGGYRTSDGECLRWGRLYRSDKLSELSDGDCHYLRQLEVCRVVDFRSNEERREEPNRLGVINGITEIHQPIPVEAAAVEKIKLRIAASDVTSREMGDLLVEANREFVEKFTDVYREWMHSLLDPDNYPQVFHCSAGKDRTGFASALVKYAVGVPMQTIMHDYMATNTYTRDRLEHIVQLVKSNSELTINTEALRALFAVEERYLQEAFNVMDSHYGGTDQYLQRGLGFGASERTELKRLLLEA